MQIQRRSNNSYIPLRALLTIVSIYQQTQYYEENNLLVQSLSSEKITEINKLILQSNEVTDRILVDNNYGKISFTLKNSISSQNHESSSQIKISNSQTLFPTNSSEFFKDNLNVEINEAKYNVSFVLNKLIDQLNIETGNITLEYKINEKSLIITFNSIKLKNKNFENQLDFSFKITPKKMNSCKASSLHGLSSLPAEYSQLNNDSQIKELLSWLGYYLIELSNINI